MPSTPSKTCFSENMDEKKASPENKAIVKGLQKVFEAHEDGSNHLQPHIKNGLRKLYHHLIRGVSKPTTALTHVDTETGKCVFEGKEPKKLAGITKSIATFLAESKELGMVSAVGA